MASFAVIDEDRHLAFLCDGVVVVEDLLPATTLDACLDDLSALCAAMEQRVIGEVSDGNLGDRLATLIAADREAYLAVAKQAQYLASMHRVSLCDPIIALLSDLGIVRPTIATRPVMHLMDDRLRVEGGYHKTPPHQDWRSYQGSLDSVVLWVAFSDVTLDSHPIEIIRGSHVSGLLPSVDDPFGHRVIVGRIDERGFEAVPVRRGSVIAFSGFTVHRTRPKGGHGLRVAASFRYNNADETSFADRRFFNPYTYRPEKTLKHPQAATAAVVTDFWRRRLPLP